MEYNAQVRRGLKRQARQQVNDHLGGCIAVQVLYLLPQVLLLMLLYLTLFGRVAFLLLSGYTNSQMLSTLMLQSMNSIWIVLFVMLLVNGPLQYGLMQYYIALGRGENPGVSTLFRPFTSLQQAWLGIRMVICLTFRSFLWMIGPMIVFIAATVAVAINAAQTSGVYPAGAVTMLQLLYFVVSLLVSVRTQYYTAGWVLLHEEPDMGAWEATRRAAQVFRGFYGRLLVFELSFLLWYLLYGGLVALCVGLFTGGGMITDGMGLAVQVAASVAGLLIVLVLSSFISAYTMTSFWSLFDTVRHAPTLSQPEEFPPA